MGDLGNLRRASRSAQVRESTDAHVVDADFFALLVDKLEGQSRRLGESKARLAERMIDEGLQVEQFPGIIFRTGPTGRRAGIAGGPDVREIVRDLKGAAAAGVHEPIDAVAGATGLDRNKVELAASYYAAHPDAVDERIRMEEQAAARLRPSIGNRACRVKLLLGEMWTPTIARELRRRSFDVVAINEPAHAPRYAGVADDAVFARAQDDSRTIVTDNISDYEMARRGWESRGRAHYGIIYALNPPFNRHRGDSIIGEMVHALEHFVRSPESKPEPFDRVHYLRRVERP